MHHWNLLLYAHDEIFFEDDWDNKYGEILFYVWETGIMLLVVHPVGSKG